MQMFVEILGRPEGRLMKLDVEARDSLDGVKAMINFEKAIPPGHQKFIFRGTVLEGSRPVSEYNIQQGSKLSFAIKRPDDLSTHVGCDYCEVTISAYTEDYMVWLCETCAANKALFVEEFDPTDYGTGETPRTKKSQKRIQTSRKKLFEPFFLKTNFRPFFV